MPCGDDLKTLLSRYVDGELPAEERTKAEDHLLSCEPCRELLSLFQKNENLVASALSTDAFGDAVIESVVRKIEREGPPEARPVEEGLIEWVRARPWLQLAAAVILVVGLMMILNVSHSNEMVALKSDLRKSGHRIDAFVEKDAKAQAEWQQQLRIIVDLQKELAELEEKRLTDNAIARAPDRTVVGYVEREHHLVAKAAFSGKDYVGFNVYRRLEAEKDDSAWKKLNPEPLETPEFVDRTARPGQSYVFKFQALKPKGEVVESCPLIMRLPFVGELSPEKSIKIHCVELSGPNDMAVFVLERVVNGRTVMAKFYTQLDKPVGGRADGIDFTTDLVLARIVPGTEPLFASYTKPVLDKDGNPVIQQFVGNEFIPAMVRDDFYLGSRLNKKAVLRLVGTTDSKYEGDLWKGSRMIVPAHAE